jgi:hypothetical protein
LFSENNYGKKEIAKAPTQTHTTTPPPGPHTFYIFIRYKECHSEPVPVATSSCSSSSKQCEYSRVRELYEIKAHKDLIECETDGKHIGCSEFISVLCERPVKECKNRKKFSWIMLAKVIYRDGAIVFIDNYSHRKWLWSNEELASCLRESVHQVREARKDRRQYVPLLAQTIKGLEYKDGKILTISENVGTMPYGITTNGCFVWITDPEGENGKEIIKIDPRISPELGYISEFIESIPAVFEDNHYKCWSICSGGYYLWLTHPDANKVSRMITSTGVIDMQVDVSENPKEMVLAGKYLCIASSTQLSILDICTGIRACDDVNLPDDFSSPRCMAYDGYRIWAASYDQNEMGLWTITIQSDDEGNISDVIISGSPINIGGIDPQGIAFDGTHIWVCHNQGLSKVNIHSEERETIVEPDLTLAGLTFDGMYLWAGQPGARRAIRFDNIKNEAVGAVKPPDLEPYKKYGISGMCFDGLFIWMIAHEENEGVKTGLVHRLLL